MIIIKAASDGKVFMSQVYTTALSCGGTAQLQQRVVYQSYESAVSAWLRFLKGFKQRAVRVRVSLSLFSHA